MSDPGAIFFRVLLDIGAIQDFGAIFTVNDNNNGGLLKVMKINGGHGRFFSINSKVFSVNNGIRMTSSFVKYFQNIYLVP